MTEYVTTNLPGRNNLSAIATNRTVVFGVLGLWLAIVAALTYAGVFTAGPDDIPLEIISAAGLPPMLFLLAYRISPRLRAFVAGLDLGVLTAIQGWRVVGGTFLFLYAFGQLPALFAFPAGVGDVAVGLAAPFVVLALLRKSAGWQGKVFWLNVTGMLDFAVAVATGLLTSPTALGLFAGDVVMPADQFPLSLFPTFGIPFFIIVHIMSFIKLHAEK